MGDAPPVLAAMERALEEFLTLLVRDEPHAAVLERTMARDPDGALRLLTLLRLLHQSVSHGRMQSQRDVYYSARQAFRSQTDCNRDLHVLCRSLGVPRLALNVYASSRGSVAGLLRIRDASGVWIDCAALGTEGKSISGDMSDLNREIASEARYIVVVEKQGIFDELSAARFYNRVPSILVTCAGVPDVATRALVARLARDLNIPALGVVDWNPGGLVVLSTYRYGSTATTVDGADHACPSMVWLGLLWSDVASVADTQPMSVADMGRLNSLRVSPAWVACGAAAQQQLALMERHECKAELQALRAGPDPHALLDWLARKILRHDWLALE